MSLKNIIKNKEENKTHFTWNGVEVFVKDPLKNKDISLLSVLASVEKKLPDHFFNNVDSIYIGEFDFLNDREIQAMYENSSIFITNDQSSEEDMGDDLVHEIAHAVEEDYREEIYIDNKIEKEFLEKRKKLYLILKSENIPADLSEFLDPSYSREFDEYLYKEVGYPLLNMVSSAMFYSPYGITSLREYFANGFEAFYYFGEYDFIKKTCPELFKKLNDLLEFDDDKEYY